MERQELREEGEELREEWGGVKGRRGAGVNEGRGGREL